MAHTGEAGGNGISQRPVVGTSLRCSSIGFALDRSASGMPTLDRRTVALLKRARSLGVTTFQVPEGSRSRSAERLLTTAFPSVDDELLVLTVRSLSSLAEEGGEGARRATEEALEERLQRSIRESTARLRPHRVDLLLWRHDPATGIPLEDVVDVLERLRNEEAYAGWILSIPPGSTSLPGGFRDPARGAPLYSGVLSVLNHSLLGPLSERAVAGPVGLFAEDPFGEGRLDGTRFAVSVADRRPDTRPLNLRELQREFAPVVKLGFLTEGRRRTLAQASLRFVLRWPWVCSAVIPLPSPERLGELARTEATPPLSDSEVARLLALTP